MECRRLRRKLYRQLAGAIAASTLILIPVTTTIVGLMQWLASDPVETGLTIVAIVDAKEPEQVTNPRDQKLEIIKQRCLQAAQVKYIAIYPPQLPRYRELREQILGPAADLV